MHALRGADLDIRAGEVHALVGENGAGKSTLLKIATGAHAPDGGEVEIDGRPTVLPDPIAAQRLGIAAIYQELDLLPARSVRENLFLGREPARFGIPDLRIERARSRDALERLGAPIDPESLVRDLDVAQQQLIVIARALLADARLLVLDEPTAALTPREVERLLALLRDLRAAGKGILFISHRLEEVLAIADRVTILRDGKTIGTWLRSELTREEMIRRMVGRPVGQRLRRAAGARGPEILAARDLSGGRVRGVSLALHAGEVLGLAGLVGSGRTDLARLLFGAQRPRSGEILLDGTPVAIRSPREAIARGIALLTEDRKAQGLVLGLSARENFSLPNLPRWSRFGWIRRREESARFLRYVDGLRIRLSGPEQPARNLSGGNQQKLLVARWLENDARVLLFDEPTRGIDVGAKFEMYNLIDDLAGQGKSILVISSELPEILALSDRILVMHEGRLTGEVRDVASATQEQLLRLAVA
ncbi:MAG: sugar ABC transporter ATP-binding protein [Candidatus Eisenbacteria bacterium]